MARRDIIVIGGSAGSGGVLRRLLEDLPPDLPASVLITTHVPSNSPGFLAEVLSKAGPLPVTYAVDGQPVERGRVYLAWPDRHLLMMDGCIRLGDGPRENMVRPAIDPMFRSAALWYGARTIGVVLSGMLNDGASGLHAIKKRGGLAVVQHPLDAQADEMPLAALEAVDADEAPPGDELGRVLSRLVGTEAGESPPPTNGLALEVEIAAGARLGSDQLRDIADAAALTCPDCGGVLSEVRGEKPLRYRCQVGHAQTAEVISSQSHRVHDALGVAMRVMEERVELVSRMARDARESGRKAVAELYEDRAAEYGHYAQTLRQAAVASMHSLRPNSPRAD
jgi:two-component system, chemotaxis family, protein-glutamate methylesterase/glutaminase